MAVPAYATDLNDIYTDTDNFSAVGGGRVTATETDDYIQGNNCWSHDPFSSGIEGGMYDTGTAPTITSGDAVFIWTKCDVAATLATHASGGIQIIMGNSTSAYYAWYVRGSDDYAYGGWLCIPVDPTKGVSTTVGSPTGTLDWFGVRWNVPSTGASKGYPMKIDAIRHGSNIEITAGEVANPASWDTTSAHDSANTRMWGICQPTDAGAAIQGDIYWGTASASVYSRDSNRTITIIDTEFTDTDFTQIIFAHASNDVEWDNIGLIALGTNNRGIIDVTANGDITWTNSAFLDIDTTTLLSSSTFDGSKWIGTNEVDGTAASLLNCKILTPTVAVNSYGLLWDTATDTDGLLDGMEFSKGTNDHHAITFGTSVTSDIVFRNMEFTGFGSTGDSNDSTVRFLATSGSLTITLAGCTVDGVAASASNFSVHDSAGITVSLNLDVNITFSGLKDNSEVRIYKVSDDSVVDGIEDATAGTEDNRTFTWAAPSATEVYYRIHCFEPGDEIYETIFVPSYTVPANDTTIDIVQKVDRNAEN